MSHPRSGARLVMHGAVIAALLSAAPAMAQSTDASHAPAMHTPNTHDATAPATPPAGQRWTTDAPLRNGMVRIRQAVGALDHLQHGHGSPALAPVLADQIQAAVNAMIAGCTLEPEADAALHGLLVKFIAGAQAVHSGPVTAEKLKPMQDALARYPVLFDDPT